MTSVLQSVNQRTQLVGQNRLELLLFRLTCSQLYGINVFKVREVLPCPNLTVLPQSNSVVRGVATVRGRTLPVIDLAQAAGKRGLTDVAQSFVIITEYNGNVQGFLVRTVERIVNLNWEDVLPPPKGVGDDHYLTAVTRVDEQLVEIIDVERVFAEFLPAAGGVSDKVLNDQIRQQAQGKKVLIVDDSKVARKQLMRVLEDIGVDVTVINDGGAAFQYLEEMLEAGVNPADEFVMLISDIEMPVKDGYTLTHDIRNHPQLKSMYVMLHSSLSGTFNQAMVEKVGADDYLSKFQPDDLARRVVQRIQAGN